MDEKLRVLKHIQKSSSSFIEEEVLPQFRETPKDFKALIQILSQDSFHDSIKTLSDEKKNLLEQSKLLDKARHREGNKIIETLKSVDSDVFSLALKKGIWNFSPRESLNILRALQKVSKSQFKKALKLQGNMDSKNQGSKTIIAALKNLLL